MPQCYPANAHAVQLVRNLTRIQGICQVWINELMITESAPSMPDNLLRDIKRIVDLAELCTFQDDCFYFTDGTGIECCVQFDSNHPDQARLLRWVDGTQQDPLERWIQDSQGRVMIPMRAVIATNELVAPQASQDEEYMTAIRLLVAQAAGINIDAHNPPF